VLEDGCVSQRVLPDHRVVLHIEAALDSSVGAAVADGDGPGEDAAEASAACTWPLGHRLVLGTAEGDGVSCDGCGAPIDAADGINMYGCSTCDYDLCAACAEGNGGARRTRVRSRRAEAAMPYRSSLSSTGYRYVRALEGAAEPGGAFEAAFYVDGKEHSLGPCSSASEAAEAYRVFVAEHIGVGARAGGAGLERGEWRLRSRRGGQRSRGGRGGR
jgi:hypothetical protein